MYSCLLRYNVLSLEGIVGTCGGCLQAVSNFDLFNLDDVDTAFGNSVQLKYSQHHLLQGQH